MAGRCDSRPAPQYHLVRHELAVVFADRPGHRQPEFGAGVPAVGDELAVFAARDRMASEAVRVEPDLVARPLIVEGEARAGMADLVEPAGKLDPGGPGRRRRWQRIGAR